MKCLLRCFVGRTAEAHRASGSYNLTVIAILLVMWSTHAIYGQSGPMEPAKQMGAPDGSYSQSGYEDVNLYNGRMNIGVPLLDVVGRGGANYNIRVPVQTQQWEVWSNFFSNPDGSTHYDNHPFISWSDLSRVDPYGPGLLEVITDFDGMCVWNTLTRVVLRTPNGAEVEFRDGVTNGKPDSQIVCPGTFVGLNRGKTFHAADGSAMKFISDTDIVDSVFSPLGSSFTEGVRALANGTVVMRDGTRYRYELGLLRKITDRNGNTLLFEYEDFVRRLHRITDSLGRIVTFAYGDRTATEFYDEITYTTVGGTPATIRVNFKPLSQNLRPGLTLLQTHQLFPLLNGGTPNGTPPPVPGGETLNPTLLSSIVFPNNRQILVEYNSYAEVARFIVPTGGYIDYEYGGIGPTGTGVYTFPDDTGVMWIQGTEMTRIMRRIKERRTYTSSAQLEGTTRYSDIGLLRPVAVDHLNSSGGIIFTEKHHFFTDQLGLMGRLGMNYVWWKANKIFKTEWLDSTGQPQRTIEYNWQQREPVAWLSQVALTEPSNDPRVADITTTFNDSGQVSKKIFTYDQFNNVTEEQIYDFGQGAPGALIRKTQTDYLVVNPVNNQDYTNNDIHLVSLPKQVRILGAGTTVQSRSDFEYDNYNDDTNNKPILPRSSIIGLDPAPGGTARGNLTKKQSALTVTSGDGPKSFIRYDVAGNVVSAKDPLGNVTETQFNDAFSDGISRNAFAYPTLTSTAVPDPLGVTGSNVSLTTSVVYDFHTGLERQSTNANGQVSTTEYDIQGRVTRIVRPSGGGETTYEYSDTPGNVFVKELVQQDATRFVESRTYQDGLGKPIRTFLHTGVGVNPWVVKDVHYDELGRVSSVLEPYNVATPGPTRAACGQCTTTTYDTLSRVKSVVTPDGSNFQTSYAGNETTTTDPTGKSKKTIQDILGRTKEIIEDPGGLAQSTTYDYDALGNLRRIVQGQQHRFFSYDALSRTVRVRNVEENVNSNLAPLTDPFTNNSQWSKAYEYDLNGNLTQQTDARGVVTTFAYDRLNRNTGVTYSNDPSGTLPISRIFDFAVKGKGNLYQSQTTGAGGMLVTIDSYNNVGNPVNVSHKFAVAGTWSQPYTITYAYTLAGAVSSITYPSGHSVAYQYDDSARTHTITGNLGDATNRTYATGISYLPSGLVSQEQFGTTTPVYNKRVYNSRNQLVEILASTSGSDSSWNRGKIVNQFSLQCSGPGCNATDNNGNLRKQETFVPANDQVSSFTSWHQQYDYDSLNRLVRVHEVTGNQQRDWQQEYQYDRWSNRTIHQTNTWGSNIPKPNFGVDPSNNNRLTAPVGFSMTYDQSGNGDADTYSGIVERKYDANNRMTQVKDGSNVSQFYTYDADGLRVRRKVNGVETWQIFGLNDNLLAEYPINGTPTSPQKEYGYRNGEVLVVADNAGPSALAPVLLTVTPPTSSTSLTLSWTAAQGAVKYRVERKGSTGSFTSIGTTTATSMADNSTENGKAYLYKVCAADAAGVCTSSYSNIGLGTAVTFTDPTIISIADDPTGMTVTSMKPAHITELRTSVNAVRTLAGMPNFNWTYSDPIAGQLIHVEDVRDLRAALDAALTILGVSLPTYTDPTIKGFIEDPLNATSIKAAHIRELRLASTKGLGGSGGAAGGSVFSMNWLIKDHLSTPRIVIDLSGSLSSTRRFDYLPFGEELNSSHGVRDTTPGYASSAADRVRQKFTIKERDAESGLDYFGARYYSSLQGRFTSPDTFFGVANNPQTLNLYAYVNNNPLRSVDPNGHWTFDVTGAFLITTMLLQQGQDPAKPTSSPVILEPAVPAGVTLKITEIGILDEKRAQELQRESASSATNWANNRLLQLGHPYGANDGLNDYLFVNNVGGLASNAGEFYFLNPDGTRWRGVNGKWNDIGWQGNGATRGRSLALAKAAAFRGAQKAFFFTGVAISGYQAVSNIEQGNYAGATKNGLDITMSAIGTFGGPYGVAIGGIYFVGDTIGWKNISDSHHKLVTDTEKVTGKSWRQHMGPIY